jgi:two-component system, LuxR family, sensor kinase FixL
MSSSWALPGSSRGPIGYAAAAAGVAITYACRLAAEPILLGGAPFLFFVLPVAAAVLYAGRGPGLLAGFLSLVAACNFIAPEAWLTPPALLQAGAFVLICAGIGWIDARLNAARRLAQSSRRQLELLLEGASSYAIIMVDPAGMIATWNAGAQRVYGWTAEQILGRSSAILSAHETPDHAAVNELAEAEREGRFSGEVWQLRSDRSEFLADLTISPIRGENGELLGYAKVVHDVTDRRANERALQRREEHLQSILATVPDAMIVIDDDGLMISFSTAAERLFGYTQAEVLGKNVSMLMPSPDRERHDEYIARYKATGVPRIIGTGRIVTGLRADGSTFPMKLSVGEAHTADQRLFTGFVQDLTEQRAFEAQLDQLKSELIHVSRLSAMGTMASTLAHELNQPLTAIATYAQAAESMLEDEAAEPDKEMLREVVTDMGSQALRAGGIVRRLREFVARGDLAKTVEDLPKLIEEAGALALVGTREKGISARFSFAPDATPVLVDRVQIQQVLINLTRNAVEAMEGADERVLSISTGLDDESTVRVTVRDTGSGIEPEVRAHLFAAFNSSKPAGMGLGLSICRTIIEAHGGRIQAMDGEAGGTEFRFTLQKPAAAEPAAS